jgi:erythritol transport system permease protein
MNPSAPASHDSTSAAKPRKSSGLFLGVLIFKLRALIALFVLIGIFSVLSKSFFTEENLIILVGQTAITAIIAVGMTFVILTGGIDLSVGSTVGLAAMASGFLINKGIELSPFGVAVYFNIPAIIVLVLCLGLIVGAFNGVLVTRFNVAPFIATLGTLYVARGTAQLMNNGATFPNLVGDPALGNTGFPFLGAGSILGIPFVIWIMALFAAAGAFIAGKTPFGRQSFPAST